MKVELPTFPGYQRSRVSWAQAIPLEWEIGWLGECSYLIQTGPFGSQLHADEYVNDGIPVINPSNIVAGKVVPDFEITVDAKKAASLQRHQFKKGDIVFARRGEMGRCALIGETEIGWICGTGSLLVRLKEKRLIPNFAALLLSQAGVRDTLTLESVGATMDNLNTRILAKVRVPVPPIEDQSPILTFLDRETAKIDRLMEVRQNQVERLQEQRTAVIHHAVTKGLDPHAKMKPSAVEWLGDIPVGWNARPLWAVSRMSVSNVDKHSFADEQPVRLCNYVDVYKNEQIDGGLPFMKATASLAEIEKFVLKKGDVLITKDSEDANDIAVPAIVTETVPLLLCGYHLAILRARSGLHANYLFRLLQTVYLRSYFATKAQGVTRFGLSRNAITRCFVPLPPVPEQEIIVAHIERETAKLDTLVEKYRRELELLAEYRASLIFHAVTGKIDVRGLVAPTQPEEVVSL